MPPDLRELKLGHGFNRLLVTRDVCVLLKEVLKFTYDHIFTATFVCISIFMSKFNSKSIYICLCIYNLYLYLYQSTWKYIYIYIHYLIWCFNDSLLHFPTKTFLLFDPTIDGVDRWLCHRSQTRNQGVLDFPNMIMN